MPPMLTDSLWPQQPQQLCFILTCQASSHSSVVICVVTATICCTLGQYRHQLSLPSLSKGEGVLCPLQSKHLSLAPFVESLHGMFSQN